MSNLNPSTDVGQRTHAGSPLEVMRIFLKLGLTCFGGPIAHIGYFRDEFVVRRKWIDEHAYADLVGLCQFLPGPASSQVGFSIGLMRAGYLGALAAWTGFTLPSASILVLFAYGAGALSGPAGAGLLHGLKLTAVAIVAQAVWGMARNLCPDRARASIAAAAALIILFGMTSIAQIGAIVLGGLAGLWLCQRCAGAVRACRNSRVPNRGAAHPRGVLRPAGGASRATCPDRIFGRRPVRCLLPLRRARLWRWPCRPSPAPGSLRCAGLAQRRCLSCRLRRSPGGAGSAIHFRGLSRTVVSPDPHGVAGAALGLVGIFLPGLLVLLGALPFWDSFRKRAGAQAMMRGVNAAVVGVLGAALYDPVWTTTVHTPRDFGIALVGFVLLVAWRAPPLIVVAFSAAAETAMALL